MNFENPHHATTTIMSWVLSLCTLTLIVIAIKICCCKPQKSCIKVIAKAIWHLLKLIVKGLVYLICKCLKKPLPLVFTSKPATNRKGKISWKIKITDSRALLTAKLPSGTLYYNHLLGLIENQDGNALKGLDIYPSPDVLNNYLMVLNKLDPPSLY